MRANTVIENYINGNLKDARQGARKITHAGLREACMDHGYDLAGACAVVDFLKNQGSFQAACDASPKVRA